MTDSPWNYLISVERIIDLHKKGIERYGGDFSPPTPDCVEGRLGNAWTAELYTEVPGSVTGFNFACFLLYYLTRDHCFTDGNKRVAWLAMVDILLKLGLTIKVTTNQAEQLCLGILLDQITTAGVSNWVAERLEAIS